MSLKMLLAWLMAASAAAAETWPVPAWEQASPAAVKLDATLLHQARNYALSGQGAGYITRHGKLVLAWGDARQKYDLKSSSKSIGVTALGLAIMDGKLRLEDKAAAVHPAFGVPPESNRETGWLEEITLFHLASQTAGFAKPGGYQPLLFRPGTAWHYSDCGPNWLAECVTLAYGRDIRELMFERVFTPIGIQPSDLTWRNNSYRPHQINGIPRREFGSGVSANVDAMARLGYLYLRRGRWQDRQLLTEGFVDQARTALPQLANLREHEDPHHGNASEHYGLLWWNNADGSLSQVPRDAYWSWGLYDSLIVVIPSLDIVVSRAGKSWERKQDAAHYEVLRPFLTPICGATKE